MGQRTRLRMKSYRSRLQRTKWRMTRNLLDGTQINGEEDTSTTSEPASSQPPPLSALNASHRYVSTPPHPLAPRRALLIRRSFLGPRPRSYMYCSRPTLCSPRQPY